MAKHYAVQCLEMALSMCINSMNDFDYGCELIEDAADEVGCNGELGHHFYRKAAGVTVDEYGCIQNTPKWWSGDARWARRGGFPNGVSGLRQARIANFYRAIALAKAEYDKGD